MTPDQNQWVPIFFSRSDPVWSPDGQSIAFLRDLSGGNLQCSCCADSGPERKLVEVASTFALIQRPFSPGRPMEGFLALIDQEAPNQAPAVFLLSTETNEKRRLTSPALESGGDYAPTFLRTAGIWLSFDPSLNRASGDLFVLPLSSGLQPQGEPKLLMSDSRPLFGLTWTLDGREIITAPGSLPPVREVCGEWLRTVPESLSVSLSQVIDAPIPVHPPR